MLDNLFTPTHLVVIAFVLGIYLLPTFISMKRRHPNHEFIAILNIFFGGTGIGWIAALLWALNAQIKITPFPPALVKER